MPSSTRRYPLGAPAPGVGPEPSPGEAKRDLSNKSDKYGSKEDQMRSESNKLEADSPTSSSRTKDEGNTIQGHRGEAESQHLREGGKQINPEKVCHPTRPGWVKPYGRVTQRAHKVLYIKAM